MSSGRKANQQHLGIKVHIGINTAHGLVHIVQVITGKGLVAAWRSRFRSASEVP